MQEPSIKGVIVQGLVEEIRRHLDQGSIRTEDLEERLAKGDLELLESKLKPAGWYPIRAYERIADLALDLEGGRAKRRASVSASATRAARPEDAVRWSVERPRPDRVVYRMDRSYD